MMNIQVNIVFSFFLSLRCFAFAQDVRPDKIPLHLSGLLLDDNGNGISGGNLQIWQTDTLGIYDHPNSMRFAEDGLDPSFQYYGTATSGEDGGFDFLTIRPEHYPMRPQSHIHFKIFVEDELVLTTQMYFKDEDFGYPDALQLELTPRDEGGFSTQKDIVVDLGNGGENPITPSQAAGPYYPVVDFFHIGNNLILTDEVLPEKETTSDIWVPAEEVPTEDSTQESQTEDITNSTETENITITMESSMDLELPITDITSAEDSSEEDELTVVNVTESTEELDSPSEEISSTIDLSEELGSPTKDVTIIIESSEDFVESMSNATQSSTAEVLELEFFAEASSSPVKNKFSTSFLIKIGLLALFVSL